LQPPLWQFSECHTGTPADLIVTIAKIPQICLMHSIVISAGICFTQIEMFCHFSKRMLRVTFAIIVQHFTPELSVFSEPNAFLRVNRNRTHLVFLCLNECNVNQNQENRKGSCATSQTVTGLWRMGTSKVVTLCPLTFAQPYIRASSLDTNFCLNEWAIVYLKYVLPFF